MLVASEFVHDPKPSQVVPTRISRIYLKVIKNTGKYAKRDNMVL